MKTSPFSQKLVIILPILSILASTGIVAQQSIRRDRLRREMTAVGQERATLEKRYRELRKASGESAAADASASESEAHHHDGDGD